MRGELTVRRARRDDFARVRKLLGVEMSGTRAERKRFRRLVANLREDLYLAEREGDEDLAGLVVIAYVRGLGTATAIVRDLRGNPDAVAALVARAYACARARGCARLELHDSSAAPPFGDADAVVWEEAGRIRSRSVSR